MPSQLSVRAEEISWKPLSRLSSLRLHCLDLGYTTSLAVREARNTNICLFQPIGRWGYEGQQRSQPTMSVTGTKGTLAFVTGERAWCTKGLGESLRSQGYLPLRRKISFLSRPTRNSKNKASILTVLSFN